MSDQLNAATLPVDENQLMQERREKLKALRQQQAQGQGVAFPNDFKPTHQADALFSAYGTKTAEELDTLAVRVKIAGRMMLKRVMGKACFATLQDASGRIQLYVTLDGVGAEALEAFKHWDLGDIVGVEGTLFRTRTGE